MSLRASPASRSVRILAATALLALACLIGILVLSPSQPGPHGISVDPADYLDPGRLAEALDYRSPLLWIGIASLLVEFAVLGLLAFRRPRRLLDRLDGRPLLGALAAGALLSLIVALAGIPFSLYFHDRAVEFGLSVQEFGSWLFDLVRNIGIGLLYAAVGALLLIVLQRRLPRRWWVAGAGVVVVFAFITSFLAPVVLAPIFNDFEPLPDGPVRSEVLKLADEAGVDVENVYSVDASSRSTTLNAYVNGIGSTRRIVLYDNLVDAAERPALRSVVAHELGHVAGNDVLRGLAFVVIVALPGMLLARELGDAIASRTGVRAGRPSALAAYALPIILIAFVAGLAGNVLSRSIEERADRFAIELTGEPQGLIDLQVQLAGRNLSDPEPPGWYQALFGSHPTTAERIGIAESYAEGR